VLLKWSGTRELR